MRIMFILISFCLSLSFENNFLIHSEFNFESILTGQMRRKLGDTPLLIRNIFTTYLSAQEESDGNEIYLR